MLTKQLIIFCACYVGISESNQCALLPGDLELTRGCTTRVHWKDGTVPRKIRYVSIKCDGRSLNSLQSVLNYFDQFNCSSPLHLQISKPSYSLEPPVFRRVASHLYHLDLLDLHPTLPGLPKSFDGLRALKMLTLRFQDISTAEVTMSKALFVDLNKLEYLKIYARSVLLNIKPDTLKTLSHLQCLVLSGSNFACSCPTLDIARWIQHQKPSSPHGQYKDPVTQRVQQCRIGTAVCGSTNEPITNQGQYNCTPSSI